MLKLFLVKLLKEGTEDVPQKTDSSEKSTRVRDRRMHERYKIDHHQLALMNQQDILPIRNISQGGFASEVSPECAERLKIGDHYKCHIRYLGDTFNCQAKLVWKQSPHIGFALYRPSKKLKLFFERLLTPLRIGASLSQVQGATNEVLEQEGLNWFIGDEHTSLFVWPGEGNHPRKWRLHVGEDAILWDPELGLTTGRLLPNDDVTQEPWTHQVIQDDSLSVRRQRLAGDILMATRIPGHEVLVQLVCGEIYGI